VRKLVDEATIPCSHYDIHFHFIHWNISQFSCFIVFCILNLEDLDMIETFFDDPIRLVLGYSLLDEVEVDLSRRALEVFKNIVTCERTCSFVVNLVLLVSISPKNTLEDFNAIEFGILQNGPDGDRVGCHPCVHPADM
jgi:hypothetical protein